MTATSGYDPGPLRGTAERHAITSRLIRGLCQRSADERASKGLCPTWWFDRTYHYCVCSVDIGHAGPHVNLSIGSVRLGSETGLCHYSPQDAVQHIRHLVVTDDPGVDDYTRDRKSDAALDWWETESQRHDHRTCGQCPAGVWEGP